MTLEEIFAEGRDVSSIITDLKSYSKVCTPWEKLEKLFDPKKHPIIADPTRRPKPKAKNGKTELPAKLPYSAEKIVSRRMTQMAFSIPVRRVYNHGDNELMKALADAIECVYKSVRINGVNTKRMYAYFAACEMATFWYTTPSETHNTYGFPCEAKIRCNSYSPMPTKFSNIKQASIWPLFDEYDDMIALSVEYHSQELGSTVHHIDCYTADFCAYIKDGEHGYEISRVPNPGKKIPASYITRPLPVYDDISDLRDDIEFTLSRNSDNIRKNSAPIIKVIGELKGEMPVGDNAREVYRLEDGGDIGMVSPALTTSDSKAHVEVLKQLIEETTQLPDLSLDNVRSLGAVSGEARKNILADAHLKVDFEGQDIIWFLDREFSVVKNIVCMLNPAFESVKDELTCTHEIIPYVMEDTTADIDKYSKACGKEVMSQRTAIEKLGIASDADEEMKRIHDEHEAENALNQITDMFVGAE